MHGFIDEYARHGNCRMSDEDEAQYLDELRRIAAMGIPCPPAQVAVVGCASEILARFR